MRKVIITGAGGFVGSALTRKFIDNGFEVVAISKSFDEKIFPKSERIIRIQIDINKTESLTSIITAGEYEAFYHLAWDGVNGPDKANPTIQIKNIQVALCCAEVAAALRCKKFLCSGTVAEQAVNSLPRLQKAHGGMMYSAAKASARILLESWCKYKQLDFLWMQFSNIYGPGNNTGNLVSYTLDALSKGEVAVFGPADQPYDFVYIDDAIEAAFRLGVFKTYRSQYFIGSGEPRVLNEYLLEIGNMLKRPDLISIGKREDDGIKYTWEMFKTDPLVEDVGPYVEHSFKSGIQATMMQRNDT